MSNKIIYRNRITPVRQRKIANLGSTDKTEDLKRGMIEKIVEETQDKNFINLYASKPIEDIEVKMAKRKRKELERQNKLETQEAKRHKQQLLKLQQPLKERKKKSWEVEQAKIDKVVNAANAKAQKTISDAELEAKRIQSQKVKEADDKLKERLKEINRKTQESREQIRESIKDEWDKANKEMKKAIVLYGTSLAKKLIKKNIDTKENNRLIEEFSKKIDISYEDFQDSEQELEREIEKEED